MATAPRRGRAGHRAGSGRWPRIGLRWYETGWTPWPGAAGLARWSGPREGSGPRAASLSPPLRRPGRGHGLRRKPQTVKRVVPDAAGPGRAAVPGAAALQLTNDAVAEPVVAKASRRDIGETAAAAAGRRWPGRCRGERVAHHGADHERPTE